MHRLCQQIQVPQIKEKTKAKTESAAKPRAAWGTAGAFCARKPPQDPEANAEFCAIRDAYHEMYGQRRGRPKANDSKPSRFEYFCKMKATIADLKDLHPGRPSTWYM